MGGEENGRRTVGPADNTNRTGLLRVETEIERAEQRQKDAHLRSSSQQHESRIGEHCREVGHRADAEEDQRRENALADAEVDVAQDAAEIEADLLLGLSVVTNLGRPILHHRLGHDLPVLDDDPAVVIDAQLHAWIEWDVADDDAQIQSVPAAAARSL